MAFIRHSVTDTSDGLFLGHFGGMAAFSAITCGVTVGGPSAAVVLRRNPGDATANKPESRPPE